MKKNYSKSKLWAVVLFSLLVSASFYSCDKERENDKKASLSNTSWECGYFEGKYIASGYYADGDTELILRCDKITISFREGIDNDEKYYWTNITIKKIEIYDPDLDISLTSEDEISESANYTYKGKNITIELESPERLFSEQNWTGKIEKDKMTLKNVIGATVEFKKI